MKALTIQINSLEGLERLIGGNSEIEIDIRNSVVQKFAEKHLKSVAKTPELNNCYQDISKSIKTELQEKVTEEIGQINRNWAGEISSITFNKQTTEKIQKLIEDKTRELIEASVQKSLEFLFKTIDEKINHRIDIETNYKIKDEVKKRLQKALD